MTKQNQAEAQSTILRLYPAWARANGFDPEPTITGERIASTDAILFFNFLQAQHSDLLQFRYNDDKWQAIHSWMIHARISD
jgi:hypothetical protein